MKNLLSILLFTSLFTGSVAGNEINYFNQTWAEIKAKAKAEHKYIFMDCYTDWCGWCKVMDKETMTDQGIITLMNDKFIAVKMDMEKGEGMKLAMKYHINGFPSFMFFNENGDYVYQSMGYQKTVEFTKELNNALDKSKQISAPGFTASLDPGFPEFYKKVYAGNGKRVYPKDSEVTLFLDQQKDLFSEISWGVISLYQTDSKYSKFFLENMDKYKRLYGAISVNGKLTSLLNKKLQAATKNKSDQEFAELLKLVDKYVSEDKEQEKINFKITYYKGTGNWNKFTEAMDGYIATNGNDNSSYINSQSWGMYEDCADKEMLKHAAKWMKEVVAKEPQYAYLDTYASILYKCGQLKDAEAWANKAIEAGKKSGDKVTSTEELLAKIKSGK